MIEQFNFVGYGFFKSELHGIDNVKILGKSTFGMIIIEHPNGYFSKEHNTNTIWVRAEDIKTI